MLKIQYIGFSFFIFDSPLFQPVHEIKQLIVSTFMPAPGIVAGIKEQSPRKKHGDCGLMFSGTIRDEKHF